MFPYYISNKLKEFVEKTVYRGILNDLQIILL